MTVTNGTVRARYIKFSMKVHQQHTDTVSVKYLYRLQWTQCQAMKINVKNLTCKSTCGPPPPYN